MDTKCISNFFSENLGEIERISQDTSEQLNVLLSGFDFIENDDLVLVYARVYQQFIATLNYKLMAKSLFNQMK